jgi:hypothetical protein
MVVYITQRHAMHKSTRALRETETLCIVRQQARKSAINTYLLASSSIQYIVRSPIAPPFPASTSPFGNE